MTSDSPADSNLDLRLAEMIATRLCHKLAAPSGALNNGIELMGLTTGAPDPEVLSLIGDSGARVVALLKFYRFVYGVSAEGLVTLPEAKTLADGYAAGGKVALRWAEDAAAALPRGAARLLLAVLAVQAAPRGGTATLAADADGDATRLSLTVEGERVDPDKAHWQLVEAAFAGDLEGAALDSRNVHAAYTGRLAAELAQELGAVAETGRLTIRAAVRETQE